MIDDKSSIYHGLQPSSLTSWIFFAKIFLKKLSKNLHSRKLFVILPHQTRTIMNISRLNKEFKFVFEPKDKTKFNNNRRFAVGAGRLTEYIGKSNTETVIRKAWEMKGDKLRFQFRETGIVDVYVH